MMDGRHPVLDLPYLPRVLVHMLRGLGPTRELSDGSSHDFQRICQCVSDRC